MSAAARAAGHAVSYRAESAARNADSGNPLCVCGGGAFMEPSGAQEGTRMKAVVLYDSAYGNTRRIAEAIAGSLEERGREKPRRSRPSARKTLRPGDLLVVGSPINGWRPTPIISAALEALGPDQLQGVRAAAFDTRVRLFIHGDAAGKLSDELRRRGAEISCRAAALLRERNRRAAAVRGGREGRVLGAFPAPRGGRLRSPHKVQRVESMALNFVDKKLSRSKVECRTLNMRYGWRSGCSG